MKKKFFNSAKSKLGYNLKALIGGPLSLFRSFNVCMWHTGRCGSTVIADLIQQDGRIDWASEILEGFSKNPPRKLVENGKLPDEVYRRINKRQKVAAFKPFGFEMKIWHYKRLDLEFDQVHDILKKIGFRKNIILERKNYLRVGVSAKVARATGQTHVKQGQQRKMSKVKFDVSDNRLIEGIKLHESFYNELKEKLPPGSLYISYENDIAGNPYNGYKKIVEYFGYEPKTIATKMKKTNPSSLSNIIENYDEVDKYLANTPYHWMLTS